MAASVMAALSPLLAMVGVSPAADAPTAWFVVGGLWLLLIAARRQSWRWACGAGLLLGAACWIRVNPLYLSLFWAAALLLFVRAGWRRRLLLGSVVVLTTILVISPIVIRNYLVFPDFSPTGGTIGANLWEGLGETELGRNHGFLFGDDKMVERERIKSGLPANAPFEAMWPDGIRRDRERARESLAFIKQHPVWYAGVMLHRMWGMVRTAGAPLPYYGTSGINVTSLKCLPPARQGGILGAFVTGLGMIQSVSRYALLPLALLGLGIGMRWDWRTTSILLMTIVYYLVPGTFAHTEIRYVLPVHYLLPVFAGAAIVWSAVTCQRFLKASQNRRLQS
jgi:4-amino-4-deoxy-L-arabinose transferase-like glycosyltransferase